MLPKHYVQPSVVAFLGQMTVLDADKGNGHLPRGGPCPSCADVQKVCHLRSINRLQS